MPAAPAKKQLPFGITKRNKQPPRSVIHREGVHDISARDPRDVEDAVPYRTSPTVIPGEAFSRKIPRLLLQGATTMPTPPQDPSAALGMTSGGVGMGERRQNEKKRFADSQSRLNDKREKAQSKPAGQTALPFGSCGGCSAQDDKGGEIQPSSRCFCGASRTSRPTKILGAAKERFLKVF